jgi:probable rRNA maturation factor
MNELIDLVIEDERWSEVVLLPLANRACRLALECAGIAADGLEITVLACSDARISELNLQFRDQAKPTNVLSWPSFELVAQKPGGQPARPPSPIGPWPTSLGDIAIAIETCAQEAERDRKDLHDHITHLILHACLHLLGYDHENDADAALMERLETKALASVGIADPY